MKAMLSARFQIPFRGCFLPMGCVCGLDSSKLCLLYFLSTREIMSAFFIQVSQVTAGQCPSLKHFPLLWLELHMEMGT